MKHASKKAYMVDHSKRRAAQRYGLNYNREMRNEIKQKIIKGDVLERQKISNARSLVLLEIAGNVVKVIWDKSRDTVVTFLPMDAPDTTSPADCQLLRIDTAGF